MDVTGYSTRGRSRSQASSVMWRWLTAASILGNIGLNYWANRHPFNGQSMGAVSAQYPTLLTPAGYAFSIWGLIFLALACYAVWQLLPGQQSASLPSAVARPLVVANVATATWVVLFAYEQILISVLTMLVILAALVLVYGRAREHTRAQKAPGWVSSVFALYLGWISVATVINLTIGLREAGWQPELNLSVLLTLLLLAIIVGLALVISKVFGELVFPLVVVWALVAIWVAQRGPYPELGWAALAGAVVTGLGSGWLNRQPGRRRRR